MDKKTPGPWFLITEDGTDFTCIASRPAIDGAMDLETEVLGSSEWLRAKRADLLTMAAGADLLAFAQWFLANRDGPGRAMAQAAVDKAVGAA